ncbi:hypothetical protein OCU04_005983 [Sclerotinia nivalis]|uniref:Uncharacterized protein n=1 Tax=Sclerotinia nivalis TaxID=352851 RepID=A0A9X0AM85_9HELO|nr:hypothetical protein OCU04_005983 [Sclerotinia nivalis]
MAMGKAGWLAPVPLKNTKGAIGGNCNFGSNDLIDFGTEVLSPLSSGASARAMLILPRRSRAKLC